MTATGSRYDIKTDVVMHAPGEHFDIAAIGAAQSPWWNRTLSAVNEAWIRLGVMEGDFHWHKHDEEDEFFLVLEGHLDIKLEDRTVTLMSGQAFTVPASVLHFPHARKRSVVLMVERAGVSPTDD